MSKQLRLPGPDSRTLIVGRTGSGKTVAAAWQLSERDFDKRAWIVVDYKRDELLNSIDDIVELRLTDPIPSKPGVYIIHPRPDEEGEVEAFLWRVWEQGNVGLYVDEGYMLPMKGKSPAFQAILTQGRSKQIPVIILSQRPVWISRFAVSEADYYQVFWLNDIEDRKTVGRFIPGGVNDRLPEYNSLWYDVKQDRLARLGPVPNGEKILATFERRLFEMREKELLNSNPPKLRKL